MSKKWKEFERIVADIQRSLSSTAVVTQNERIRGKNSGVLREVDVCVRQRIAQFDILVAISCKDHAVPIDVPEVEAFATSLEDIGAHKGAMVSAKGFSEGARTLATRKGIDLYRLVDTDHLEWASYLTIPTLVRNLNLKWRVVFEAGSEGMAATHRDHETDLYSEDRTPLGSVRALVMQSWKTGGIPETPGEYTLPDIAPRDVFVRSADRYWPVRVRVEALVSYQWFLGNLPLSAVRGLTDESTGALKIQRMQTEWLRFEDLQKWERIETPEDLAVKPILTFLVKDAPAGDPDAVRSVRLRMDDSGKDSEGE